MDVRIKLLGKQHLPDRLISLNDSDGVVQKNKFKLPDSWYGGSVKEFRKIKDSNFLMCMDRKDRIINIAYDEDTLTDDEKRLIGLAVDDLVDDLVDDTVDDLVDDAIVTDVAVVSDEIVTDAEMVNDVVKNVEVPKSSKKK